MSNRIIEPHGSAASWSASGGINLELSPKPYTLTSMMVVCRADITTTTATNFNDYWDRLINRLTLTGKGKTYFDFSNMRAAYHMSRYQLRSAAPRRPTVIANSQTNALQQFAYMFHFGVAPFEFNPITGQLEYNPWDLTGGIMPTDKGNLTLGGAFAAADKLGTNVTVNDGDLDVYCFGVREESGDSPADWMPRATPNWSMATPTPSATSTAFATSYNIPSGDFLKDLMVMLTNGTNAPRDDAVLNSIRLYNQKAGREIVTFGGQAGAAADYKAAELFSQMWLQGAPASDDATAGVPAITQVADEGLFYLPVHRLVKRSASEAERIFGLDIRSLNTGDLQLRYGVSDATGITMDVVHRKYQLNPEHPANAGL